VGESRWRRDAKKHFTRTVQGGREVSEKRRAGGDGIELVRSLRMKAIEKGDARFANL